MSLSLHSFTIPLHLVSSASTNLSIADIGKHLGSAPLPALTDDKEYHKRHMCGVLPFALPYHCMYILPIFKTYMCIDTANSV